MLGLSSIEMSEVPSNTWNMMEHIWKTTQVSRKCPFGWESYFPLNHDWRKGSSKQIYITTPSTWKAGCWRMSVVSFKKMLSNTWGLSLERYCWWFRNPANQLRLVVYLTIYRVFLHPRWCRISEPSTVLSFNLGFFQEWMPQTLKQSWEKCRCSLAAHRWQEMRWFCGRPRKNTHTQKKGWFWTRLLSLYIAYTYSYICWAIAKAL